MMRSAAMLREALVGGYQKTALGHRDAPKAGISQPLASRPADVLNVVAEFAQTAYGHARDVLVHKNVHASEAGGLDRRDLLLR